MDPKDLLICLKCPFNTFFHQVTGKTECETTIEQLFSVENTPNEHKLKNALTVLIGELQNTVAKLKGDSSTCEQLDFGRNKDDEDDGNKQNVQEYIKSHQHLVQIQADNKEIERRIKAFVEKKRLEADDMNVREFCNLMKLESGEDHCARTDAVYVAGMGGKSHVRVTRVDNQCGPQTLTQQKREPTLHQMAPSSGIKSQLIVGVEERLHNMEEHLGLTHGISQDQDIYQRLKKLENRILYLESLSPEYFTSEAPVEKKSRYGLSTNHQHSMSTQQEPQDMKLGDIDQRIYMLKQSLLSRKHMMNVKVEPH